MENPKNLPILNFAVFQAFLALLIGLLLGILYSFGGLLYDVYTTGSVNAGTALAFLALIGMPIIAASAGFALGIVESVLYNICRNYFPKITDLIPFP